MARSSCEGGMSHILIGRSSAIGHGTQVIALIHTVLIRLIPREPHSIRYAMCPIVRLQVLFKDGIGCGLLDRAYCGPLRPDPFW